MSWKMLPFVTTALLSTGLLSAEESYLESKKIEKLVFSSTVTGAKIKALYAVRKECHQLNGKVEAKSAVILGCDLSGDPGLFGARRGCTARCTCTIKRYL